MKNKAINALIEMGMPANIKGFKYIIEAMCLFGDYEWRSRKITMLYHEIGKRNNDTPSRVEQAIRHAFGVVLSKNNKESLEKYLTIKNPTNSNLLHVLYLRLSQEE